MNYPATIGSLVALLIVIAPCGLYFAGTISLDAVKWSALTGTIGWFIATPMWMNRELPIDAGEVEI